MNRLIVIFALILVALVMLAPVGCQLGNNQVPDTPTLPPITSPPSPKADWEEGSPPPEGIEGWEQPRPLTKDEKAEVVEIALGSQRTLEWLQGRTDYRAGSVDWYAIIWNSDGEAGTWWSVEYDRVTNGGIPDFVSPYALWYPGVTIAVGESTIYQMQIAVDLDVGKTALVMGPYPSLSSPDRFKNILGSSPEPGVEAEIKVEPALGNYLCNAFDESSPVILKDVMVGSSVCDRKYTRPPLPIVNVGDPCLVVSGQIQNMHQENSEIAMYAEGYNASGEQVAWTLDAAHIVGQIGLHLEYEETGEFTLHLNLSENTSTIQIYANNYSDTPP